MQAMQHCNLQCKSMAGGKPVAGRAPAPCSGATSRPRMPARASVKQQQQQQQPTEQQPVEPQHHQGVARGHRTLADSARAVAMGCAASLLLMGAAPMEPAMAELNKYEYSMGGEFQGGTSQQWGEADIDGKDFSNQDLRRSNFTSASCKKTNFSNSQFQGAYFIKAVLYEANFENAGLQDVLMDRAVMNKANLRNANLERTILTISDLTDADIYGADFSNALLDRTMQIKLCRYADGVNTQTGVSTRASLGCGSMRKFRQNTPSAEEGPQVTEEQKQAFQKTLPTYRS